MLGDVERRSQSRQRSFRFVGRHHDAYFDLAGIDHLHVNGIFGQCAEHASPDVGVAAESDADDRQFSNVLIERNLHIRTVAGRRPQQSDALPDLVAEFESAGLTVALVVTGAVESVPRGIALSVYRIAQEALTNTMKHSEATTAQVLITVDGAEVGVTVTDHGPARVGHDVDQSAGRGLVGIAERAQLHGGQATFGPNDNGGFTVVCTLPLVRTEVGS